MEIILGFIVMLVLVVISSVPIFIMLKFKNSYSNIVAWVLFFLCGIIYVLLKVACIEFGILDKDNNTPIPVVAMFVFYFLSRIGITEK